MSSILLKRKDTVPRFRLPYTDMQVYSLLCAACKAEVEHRRRTFDMTRGLKERLWDIAGWLTGESPTFGLFLCGGAGNGKTTILLALQNLYHYLHSNDERHDERGVFPIKGFYVVTAKELVLLAKAYNNPTRENGELASRYKRIRDIAILAIDDLGQEPRESMHYGDFVTAAMDMLTHRYNAQLCTLVSSNLAPDEIGKYYDERIADRFREMMHIVSFGGERSFRKD